MRDSEPEPVTIASIENITKEVEVDAQYNLPLEVEATMSDNSKKNVAVTWEPSTVDTSKVGTVEFTGTVEGFDGKVKLTLTVKEKELTVEEVKAAFLQELDNKVKNITVAEVVINDEDITVTFDKPADEEEETLKEAVKNVHKAAEELVNAMIADGVKGTIEVNGEDYNLEQKGVEIKIALNLLKDIKDGAKGFLVNNEEVNVSYIAKLTKGEVAFTLEGNLVFTVAK